MNTAGNNIINHNNKDHNNKDHNNKDHNKEHNNINNNNKVKKLNLMYNNIDIKHTIEYEYI